MIMDRKHCALSLLLLLTALPACNEGGKPFSPAACGLAEYEWLPPGSVGQVIALEEDPSLRMSASALQAMLDLAGQNPFGELPYGARLYHLRYTTQDRGRPVEATGMVALPWIEGQAARAFPLVLWLHGTTGFVGECAPSARSRRGEPDALVLVLVAAMGYVVVGPDYIGLDADSDPDQPPPVTHAYLGMEQVALGSWDMVRAVETVLSGELAQWARPDSRVIPWGGSQGGHAALACDRYAPLYAPEYEVPAVVSLIPGTDLVALAEYALSDTNAASVAVAAALVAQHLWYEGQAPLSEVLTTDPPWHFDQALADALYGSCSAGEAFEGVDRIEQVYQADAIARISSGDWQDFEPWACYLRQNSASRTDLPPHTDTPIFFVTGENDDLAYTPVARQDVLRLCAQGHRIEYLECADAGHVDASWWSLPEQLAWVEARLAGQPLDPAKLCTIPPPQRCSAQPTP